MSRIGISACFFHADPARPIFKGKTLLYLEQSMAHWVQSAGAITYLVPTLWEATPARLKEQVADLDGLVLQGGSDVSPSSYGETPLKPEWNGDSRRDDYEIALVREFRAQGKPVLGVCRGIQLLNVAFGGTLHQDIETQVPGALKHRDWDVYDGNFHGVDFSAGSKLERLFPGRRDGKVNTVHHQAVKKLGTGLVAEATSRGDGLVEAFRAAEGPYLYAVQWHPEFMDPQDASLLDGRAILQDFLRECHASNP